MAVFACEGLDAAFLSQMSQVRLAEDVEEVNELWRAAL
jgi:hypothetical protein